MNPVLTTVLSDSPLSRLLGPSIDASFVGYVFRMSYDECLVQTNDKFKKDVNGIPHNSFLVAAGFDPASFSDAPAIDQEVVLLRVLGPTPLPQDGDMVRTRIEHHQRRLRDERLPVGSDDGLDPMTANELQWGGMRCRVLGTFYMEGGQLRLGSDLESFMALSRMRAYKPRGEALQTIVNHINPETRQKAYEDAKLAGFSDVPKPIIIGTVRYTSTARLHRGSDEPKVPVEIQPADFLARRTAVLGMTRTGKSNTVKTTIAAVALAAMKSQLQVGQLVFDVNGEYANANHQDDASSIATVFGPQRVVRYRALPAIGFNDLRTNFYEQPIRALPLLQSLFKDSDSSFSGQDLETFMSMTLTEPDPQERGDHLRWERHIAVFQCLLHKAGYPSIKGFRVKVPNSKKLISGMESVMPEVEAPEERLLLADACDWFLKIREANLLLLEQQRKANQPNIGIKSSSGNAMVDPTLEAMLNMLARESTRRQSIGGYRALTPFTAYHSPQRQQEVTAEIIAHLDLGKIVILDLSVGPVEIRRVLSERIAREIFDRQMGQLNSGEVPRNVVIYVEEAHNLIGKKSELTDPWPRIAKEGAKAKIAFVYATQEPSSVHPNILANTENWFVTHLNNDDELRTLAKFYDFSDFSASLKSAQDVGFARIKTLSAPFVIPTQINRFTPELIQAEMRALGLTASHAPAKVTA
ncbi:DUF87 domain-containing protein [Luteibacter sp. 3190]|uniref:ATP-binding protein n=1 Tax=Luteibacter sp. 3190 TaxID=2817736 RepID=UPI00285D175A|nr:DUF87 domain-containing protein [Luteibacter sp. 3190]MDR6935356.1 hypothetical protein [Luteibacter sp. 3190]